MIILAPSPRPRDFHLRPFVQARLLDPRSESAARLKPIVDSANIPLSTLDRRMAELPPRDESIHVAGVDECEATIAWLAGRERRAVRCDDFEFGARRDDCLPRLWRPTPFVEQAVAGLRPGRAIDVACGGGRDAIHLAARGWSVWANDILPDAIDRACSMANHFSGSIEPIRWSIGAAADLHGVIDESLDLMICMRFFDRMLLSGAGCWISPGGSVLVESFTTLHRERFGKAGRLLAVEPGELPKLFSGWTIDCHDESWRADGSHTARIHARRN